MKYDAEVVSVGNELLIGHTLDTNSNWIAQQLNRFGWTLQRVTVLRDSLAALRQGISEAVMRRPQILITVGGLGPTHDDMTLKGISRAVRKPLILNNQALNWLREKYEKLDASANLNKYRRKMAMLPRGSKAIPNPLGTAPGVLTKIGRTTIVSLPGVPKEMKAIFNTSVGPMLQRSNMKRPVEAYLGLLGIVESALAPKLAEAQRKFPGLYFKSHPRGLETGVRSRIQLHIYTVGERDGRRVNEAAAFLLKRLASSKGPG